MTDISELIKGAIDVHIHAGPSAVAREIDSAEMMLEAEKAGYRAIVIKDHYFPTMMSAAVVQNHIGDKSVKIYGGLALNNSVGGFNLKAVDVAKTMGAKVIWMPTVSTRQHVVSHEHGLKFPATRGVNIPEEPMVYVNEKGELDPKALRIIEYVAGTDMILATGHGSLPEVDAVVTHAARLGVKHILVNHPQYIVEAPLSMIKKWAGLGAYIELNAVVYVPESHFGVVPLDGAASIIREIDKDRIILDSDYGQKNNGSPVAGLKKFVEILISQYRVSEDDIARFLKINPARLMGLPV